MCIVLKRANEPALHMRVPLDSLLPGSCLRSVVLSGRWLAANGTADGGTKHAGLNRRSGAFYDSRLRQRTLDVHPQRSVDDGQ
jgi:hypothetical protein